MWEYKHDVNKLKSIPKLKAQKIYWGKYYLAHRTITHFLIIPLNFK
jgi:hypothetical protein